MRTFVFVLFGVLTVLAVLATFRTMARASKGYDRAKQRRIATGPQTPCPVCRSSMQLVGLQELMLGERATSVDRPVAEALGAEGRVLPVEVYRCPTCRKLELFLPPSAG